MEKLVLLNNPLRVCLKKQETAPVCRDRLGACSGPQRRVIILKFSVYTVFFMSDKLFGSNCGRIKHIKTMYAISFISKGLRC